MIPHSVVEEAVFLAGTSLPECGAAMRRRDFSNSPLEKGDKGGCEAEAIGLSRRNEEENKKQPPPPPFLRGNVPETCLGSCVQPDL